MDLTGSVELVSVESHLFSDFAKIKYRCKGPPSKPWDVFLNWLSFIHFLSFLGKREKKIGMEGKKQTSWGRRQSFVVYLLLCIVLEYHGRIFTIKEDPISGTFL